MYGLMTSIIEKEPGVLMGPIDSFLGFILNGIFNAVNAVGIPGAFGVTIIIFTILIRLTLLPSGIKMQKSTLVVKKLQPEVDKIKAKYGNSKDPEIARKIQTETQALYVKHKYNPLGGCLPLLVTMPIFMALNYLLRQPFMFVDEIKVIYESLALAIMRVDNYRAVIVPLVEAHLPTNGSMSLDINLVSDVIKALNKFSPAEWANLQGTLAFSGTQGAEFLSAFARKTEIENFLGFNLLANAGWAFPGILIPIISALTQFLSAYYGYKVNPPQDSQAKSTQMMMMIMMPLVMGFVTVGITLGVGFYWVIGNVFMLGQQVFITKVVLKQGETEVVRQ